VGVGCSGNRRYFYPHVYFRGQFSISLFGPSIHDGHYHCPIGRRAACCHDLQPTNGSVFSAPATLALTATASEADGSVTNVEFFQGDTSLAKIMKAPYSVSVNNLAAGDYALSAVATGNSGVRATNTITIRVVTPVAVALGSPNRVSATIFQFRYTANPGLSYLVQRSANLQDWTPISTNTATGNPTSFSDNAAMGNVNFYRVQLLPNP